MGKTESGKENRSTQTDLGQVRDRRRLGCQSLAFIAIGNTSFSIRRFMALNKRDEIKLFHLIVLSLHVNCIVTSLDTERLTQIKREGDVRVKNELVKESSRPV